MKYSTVYKQYNGIESTKVKKTDKVLTYAKFAPVKEDLA